MSIAEKTAIMVKWQAVLEVLTSIIAPQFEINYTIHVVITYVIAGFLFVSSANLAKAVINQFQSSVLFVNEIHDLILWGATIILVVAGGLLIHSLMRVGFQPADGMNQNQIAGKRSLALDVLWTVLPMAFLATLLVLTFQAVY